MAGLREQEIDHAKDEAGTTIIPARLLPGGAGSHFMLTEPVTHMKSLDNGLHRMPSWTEDFNNIFQQFDPMEHYSYVPLHTEVDDDYGRLETIDGTVVHPVETLCSQEQFEHTLRKLPREKHLCSECGMKFTERWSLTRHQRTRHTDQRPFECQSFGCFSKFMRSDVLERHQRETHRKIEPVECMRCGKLVKDRSLDEHLKSRACLRHVSNIEHESHPGTSSSEERKIMLTAIFEQTEGDRLLFGSFSAHGVCNALSTSSYLSYKAAQSSRISSRHGSIPFVTEDVRTELCILRGLSIRSIVRGLNNQPLDDELDGAIRAFALTERMLFPDAANIHEEVIQWLDKERHHRVQKVLSVLKGALDQWTPTSTIIHHVTAPKSTESSKAIIRKPNPTSQHPVESRKPTIDLTLPHIPPRMSSPGLKSMKGIMADDDDHNDGTQPSSTTLTNCKRKRKSNEPASNRPNQKRICPEEGCGVSVVQKGMDRHFRQVHGQGELYGCDDPDCEEVFHRKDSFSRHKYYQHGEGSIPIACLRCGKPLCQRAMKEHLRKEKCQKKNS